MKFTGHGRDFNGASASNHLDYMRARYYSPHLGRFMSPDRASGSVEAPQSWNRYAYARNNPLKFVDPDGEVALGVAVKVVKLVIKGGDIAATVAGIVADAQTIASSDASLGERALAAVSIASEFISPVSLKEVKGIRRSVGSVSGGASESFEIVDGVRRAKANELLGNQTINANIRNSRGELTKNRDVPIDSLRSPNKDKIDISTEGRFKRFDQIRKGIQEGDPIPPIEVIPGSRGIPVREVEFDPFGDT